jgi:hypothetical protein
VNDSQTILTELKGRIEDIRWQMDQLHRPEFFEMVSRAQLLQERGVLASLRPEIQGALKVAYIALEDDTLLGKIGKTMEQLKSFQSEKIYAIAAAFEPDLTPREKSFLSTMGSLKSLERQVALLDLAMGRAIEVQQ